MKKIVVSDKCNGCGLCTLTEEFLKEDKTGKAVPIAGRFIKKGETEKAKSIVKKCPVGALSIVEQKAKKTMGEFFAEAEKRLLSISEMKSPSQNDFPYKSSELNVPLYGAAGESRYEYSSHGSANNAAEREFNSKMYSQLKPFALKLVMQYKAKYLARFYILDSESVYEKKNNEIKKILLEIAGEYEDLSRKKMPSGFTDFSVTPDAERNSMLYMLQKDTVYSDEIADLIARKFQSEYPLSHYSTYWDIDSEEKYVGKGLFGDKYKTMYGYRNVYEANEKFHDDLLWIAGYADINVIAHDKACVVVSQYNTNMQKEIKKKIEMLKKA